MFTKVNRKARKNFVGHQSRGVNMYLATPINKATRSQLTLINSVGERIDLDGVQIKELKRVLQTGYALKESKC